MCFTILEYIFTHLACTGIWKNTYAGGGRMRMSCVTTGHMTPRWGFSSEDPTASLAHLSMRLPEEEAIQHYFNTMTENWKCITSISLIPLSFKILNIKTFKYCSYHSSVHLIITTRFKNKHPKRLKRLYYTVSLAPVFGKAVANAAVLLRMFVEQRNESLHWHTQNPDTKQDLKKNP